MDLLQDVKDHLSITWDDDDAKLLGIIERGQRYLQMIAGTNLVFDEENLEKQLLLDYCRYARDGVIDMFQKNYKQDLLLLQLTQGLK